MTLYNKWLLACIFLVPLVVFVILISKARLEFNAKIVQDGLLQIVDNNSDIDLGDFLPEKSSPTKTISLVNYSDNPIVYQIGNRFSCLSVNPSVGVISPKSIIKLSTSMQIDYPEIQVSKPVKILYAEIKDLPISITKNITNANELSPQEKIKLILPFVIKDFSVPPTNQIGQQPKELRLDSYLDTRELNFVLRGKLSRIHISNRSPSFNKIPRGSNYVYPVTFNVVLRNPKLSSMQKGIKINQEKLDLGNNSNLENRSSESKSNRADANSKKKDSSENRFHEENVHFEQANKMIIKPKIQVNSPTLKIVYRQSALTPLKKCIDKGEQSNEATKENLPFDEFVLLTGELTISPIMKKIDKYFSGEVKIEIPDAGEVISFTLSVQGEIESP